MMRKRANLKKKNRTYNLLVALAGQLPRVINLYLYAYLIMTFF